MSAVKKLILSVMAFALLSALLYYFVYASPNAKWNSPQRYILDQFYQAFQTKDYSMISPLIFDRNPQMVINIRHWYGDVKSYHIQTIRSVSSSEKQAVITVTSLREGKEHRNTDTILLAKQDGGWAITSYNSDLEYKLP
ncbi:hypothetical protein [Paenibacillus sp. 32352]|uniref:hypothetical protein n=1 Tax=Paenibacillus sp. 32352 TaxID=1969111 RepID=UPI0009AD17D4|nr:hypothetical protein [Paenibacillus sp. 32352]